MNNPLGILAGGDSLSAALINYLKAKGKSFFVITFVGQPKPEGVDLKQIPHLEITLGAVGKAVKEFKKREIADVVMVGCLDKPALFDLKPDMLGLKVLANSLTHHDDALLKSVSKALQDNGITMHGAHEFLPDLITKVQCYTKKSPSADDNKAIELGLATARKLGEMDVGQAVIVKDNVVLGLEGAEGTSALVERCAQLRGSKNNGGMLVKTAKPQQELKLDMPVVGPKTIELLAKHNYAGLVIEANRTILLNPDQCIATANKAGLFIVGVK